MKRQADGAAAAGKRARGDGEADKVKEWAPGSWRGLPIKQQPTYKDEAALEAALGKLRTLPPLVHSGEIDQLKAQLAEAARGERFLLQGGDCAEAFKDCTTANVENKLKVLLQMSLVLAWGGHTPLVRIARIAGQFAKPRSSDTEIVDGKEILSYRGDNVNGFDPDDREADPNRLLEAYFYSASTLNYLRSLLGGGMADIQHTSNWNMGFVRSSARRKEYEAMTERIHEALSFLDTIKAKADESSLKHVDMYSSHECLLLPYEEALTREVDGKHYNLSAHFVWVGDRTRQLDGAHLEFLRGIENPIGIKVGPSMKPDELVAVIKAVNPTNEPGRVTLIHRLGAGKVDEHLPGFIHAVQDAELVVVWSCDPMHGNTVKTSSGVKTRKFDDILSEIHASMRIHLACQSRLNGVHLELTGDDVTEVLGGGQELVETGFDNYTSQCDPRLNANQSLEVAFLLAKHMSADRIMNQRTPLPSPP